MKTTLPKARLLLVGADLTHICLIQRLSPAELEKLKIILVAPFPFFYYQEMAAGLLTETFQETEVTIDIAQICNYRGVHFLEATPIKIDVLSKSVTFENGRNISYDILSLNLGHQGRQVEGVEKYGVPIACQNNLLKIKQYFTGHLVDPNLTIIGGGKPGIEIALALRQLLDEHRQKNINITIIEAAHTLLPGYDLAVKEFIQNELKQQRIELLLGRRVVRVTGDLLIFQDNSVLDYGYLIWTPKPVDYPFTNNSGLVTGESGRLVVCPSLQAVEDFSVFGSGIGTELQSEGRQVLGADPDYEAGLLLRNFIQLTNGQPLSEYQSKGQAKDLIMLGPRRALVQKKKSLSVSGIKWGFQNARNQKFIKMLQKTV
jgi:NADH dehydrogenase FAD-containing subunit